MYKGDIPFHPNTGDQMNYPQNGYRWKFRGQFFSSWLPIREAHGEAGLNEAERITIPPDWRPNKPFRTKMEIRSMSRGRSAANFTLRDDANKEYSIFLTDLLDILQQQSIVKGWTEKLTWSFCKRGQNYGVRLHESQDYK